MQTFLVFQDVSKTSSRRLQRNTFRLPRPLQDVFKTCLQDVLQLCLQEVFKTSSRRLERQKNVTLKTSWRCLQYVFNTSSPRRMFAGFKWLNNILYMLFFWKKKVMPFFSRAIALLNLFKVRTSCCLICCPLLYFSWRTFKLCLYTF